MQKKEDRRHIRPNKKRRRKKLEANKEKESNYLFTTYTNLWYDYVNACNSMNAEYIRNTTKMTESWLDSISKFWSGQYRDRVKVE
jgi:hypothetical protein